MAARPSREQCKKMNRLLFLYETLTWSFLGSVAIYEIVSRMIRESLVLDANESGMFSWGYHVFVYW
jgi:hypothetical protein